MTSEDVVALAKSLDAPKYGVLSEAERASGLRTLVHERLQEEDAAFMSRLPPQADKALVEAYQHARGKRLWSEADALIAKAGLAP